MHRYAILALLALCLVAPALSEQNGSYVVVVTPTPDQTPIPTPRPLTPYIYQGDTVYLGTYVDVSGVIPPYPQIAYWDGFDMYDEAPSYNISMPDGKRAYYQFYVDPEIFASRPGRWYKYSGEYEEQGNNLAFVVSRYPLKNTTLTYSNGTVVNISEPIVKNYTEHVVIPEPLMPERHISDYVSARGQDIVWPDGDYRMWLFGRLDGVYDHPANVITAKEVAALEPGRYTLVIHTGGNNTIQEVNYRNNTLIPGLYGKQPVDIRGMSAPVVLQEFRKMVVGTDDKVYEYNLDIDEPYITINRADEMWLINRTVLDVRGYTNVANGTKITVTLDEKYLRDYKATTTAVRTSPGNLSYFRAYVPLNYDELAADARNHTLIASTAAGGSVQKDFKISIMPADSYRPNATLKYIEDRNPFVPTPTPAIVTVVKTQVVVERVTVPVTPSPLVVYEQQKRAQDATFREGLTFIAIVLIVTGFLGIGVWYGLTVWRRL